MNPILLELFPFPFPLTAKNYFHSHEIPVGFSWEWDFSFPCTPLVYIRWQWRHLLLLSIHMVSAADVTSYGQEIVGDIGVVHSFKVFVAYELNLIMLIC